MLILLFSNLEQCIRRENDLSVFAMLRIQAGLDVVSDALSQLAL